MNGTELAAAILADVESAAVATDAEEAVEAMSRAFAGILRIDAQDQVSVETVGRILKPFWLVSAAVRMTLPPWYWHDRGWTAFVSAYGMLRSWAEAPGSKERLEACHPAMVLLLRVVRNDLDSLLAAYELKRLSPAFPPASVLMPGSQHVAVH